MSGKMTTRSLIGSVIVTCTLGISAQNFADGNVYSAYDQNFDGFLDHQEFEVFLKKRRVKATYQHLWLFDKVDVNGDGLISNKELVKTLKKEIQLRNQRRKS